MITHTSDPQVLNALSEIWSLANDSRDALDNISLFGSDPILPTNFKVGTAASVSIGAASLAALEVWRYRTGREQNITLSIHDAAIAFCSEHFTQVNNKPVMQSFWSPASGHFNDKDGNWVQLHCQYPHLRDGVLRVLECENESIAVQKAVERWSADELELCAESRDYVLLR